MLSQPNPDYRLPPDERARLKPGVDANALETLLQRLPVEAHPSVLLACRAEFTHAEWSSVIEPILGIARTEGGSYRLHFLTEELNDLWTRVHGSK